MHQAVLDTFDLSEKTYRLNPLRYRLRKSKGRPDRARRLALRLPALIQGRPSRPAFPLLPQAPGRRPRQTRLHHRPDPEYRSDSRLEAAYRRANTAIQRVVDLLAAARSPQRLNDNLRLDFVYDPSGRIENGPPRTLGGEI